MRDPDRRSELEKVWVLDKKTTVLQRGDQWYRATEKEVSKSTREADRMTIVVIDEKVAESLVGD